MKNILYSSICGDIIGSFYESKHRKVENKNFQLFNENDRFTDDTVLTIAIADNLMHGNIDDNRIELKKWTKKYPHAGYGKMFKTWALNDETNDDKVDSWGNGALMRIVSVGWINESLDETLDIAKKSAMWTHNHQEALDGACATVACIWLARHGKTKQEIKDYIKENYPQYNLDRTVQEVHDSISHFSSKAFDTFQEAFICFFESDSYEDAIRNCVWLNDDTDTCAAICGSFAAPFYGGVPQFIVDIAKSKLTEDIIDVINEFDEKYG